MGVGMPEFLYLNEFGSHVYSAFGHPPYHVGSSAKLKTGWRDVDVRLILPDDEYEALGLGHPHDQSTNAKWTALCLAFSALGKQMTGLPIDFQIQQQTEANKRYKEARNPLGLVGLRFPPAPAKTQGGKP